MFDFFGQLLGYIEVLWFFFLNLIESMFQGIGFVVSSIPFVMGLTAYMPGVIASCMIIVMSLCLVKFMIGR